MAIGDEQSIGAAMFHKYQEHFVDIAPPIDTRFVIFLSKFSISLPKMVV